MRSMQLDAPGPIESRPLRSAETGPLQPGPGEILIKVATCAVCRTDLQLCEGDLALHKRPVVPGHQMVGRVIAVGEGVERWREGDRVGAAWLGGACGHCPRCTEERENLCPYAEFTGWDRDGGYATHALVRADFALEIPAGFDDVHAAPLLCGGVIGYRALRVSGIKPGGTLGLYGFGASALLSLQVARFWGCRVYVCTRSEREQRRARELGAEWAGGYDEAPPEPLDAAVTFAPVGSVVVAALKATGRGGAVAINAIHLDQIPSFSYDYLWLERSLRSVANFTRRDAREFLEIAAKIPIEPVVDEFRLDEANQALSRLKAGGVEGAAVLVVD
ncbi:MAG: zinc-dependent alcohol dehydrogenase family protein [Polyangiaceae bacterium]|nr:zinc-dependent alcohol dehydrogenase family protein [Polyangiaceae bacterium]